MDLPLSINLVKKEFNAKYSKSLAGLVWFFLEPLFQLTIFAVVFTLFLGMKVEGEYGVWSYSLYLIPGIILWNFLVDVITRLSHALVKNKEFLKKTTISTSTIFLAEIIYSLMVSLIYLVLFIFLYFTISFFLTDTFPSLFTLVPQVFYSYLLAILLGASVGIFFSFITPFYNQLTLTVQVIMNLMFWFIPIVYTADKVPELFINIVLSNPVYFPIQSFQSITTANAQDSNIVSYITCLLISSLLCLFMYKRLNLAIKEVL
ncbi:ABC transporter permease [Catenovulum sp. SM1970]|uniref:ABC transporter permease n=1 Tax=Marinifaba aquimaris TaxID=2741323 RepID=UPI0015716C35|nr:ABC transporter permease [Marinifaba aquimaris]NTS76929.1 ABC transporter permease [Marinifaba aquimaris]